MSDDLNGLTKEKVTVHQVEIENLKTGQVYLSNQVEKLTEDIGELKITIAAFPLKIIITTCSIMSVLVGIIIKFLL